MNNRNVFVACVLAGAMFAPAAWARTATTDEGMAPHRHVIRHHVAHYRNPATVSDAQENLLPEAKPVPVPEYFYHASGIDGAQ